MSSPLRSSLQAAVPETFSGSNTNKLYSGAPLPYNLPPAKLREIRSEGR
jgi:hypothetical protein